ncbi:MAG TPA: tyrosine--tRNA ligase [Candidatus Paceibacterota bacterium]|nr:tyrosine--tRNA ligase [Candidatus Paceibacterota bacterium]
MANKIDTDVKKIDDILSRSVEDIIVKEHLREQLLSGKKLRIKFGIDPTGPSIHLGRAVPLWKLRAFQDLGHQVVIIVGDFTTMIGDPSDKLEKRPMLDRKTIEYNMKNYKKIIGKIIDIKKAEFTYNSSWLKKLNFLEISQLAETFSVQQMSSRRNFKDRIDAGTDISLREFLYPLMQGYDSVAVKSDVEIGGFDQLFNVKAGRTIQKHYGQPEQDILTTAMLEGTDGRKMSTSWGNVILITDEANDMFGKIMSIKDELIAKYLLLTTNTPLGEIAKIEADIAGGANPRDAKVLLGKKVVAMYHGEKEAEAAYEAFVNTFQKKEIPDDIEEVKSEDGEKLGDLLVRAKVVESKSEFRRLVEQRGVHKLTGVGCNEKGEGEKVEDQFAAAESGTYKIGKRRFIKII